MLTVEAAAALLRRRELSSVELVRAALDRADVFDDRLGAYVTRFDEAALAAAKRADADFAAGVDRGPLQGIPVGIKDNLFTEDGPTTAQSLVRDPSWDGRGEATAVTRLKAGGAVVLGKLTLSEFAIGPPAPGSPFPRPRNPWDLRCWPGGSSSGTGVAVASGFVLAGLGTDSAGSIRLPAAACGITGLKPTFGRVPVSGSVPLAASLDHVGPMARSVWDCAAVLQTIAGHDESDATSLRAAVPDYLAELAAPLGNPRIGVVPAGEAHPAVRDAFDAMLSVLRSLGMATVTADLPEEQATVAATKIILSAESFETHRSGLRSRWQDYGSATRVRLATGAFVSDIELRRARQQRESARRRLAELFRSVDVVVSVTMPVPAPEYGPDDRLDRGLISAAAETVRYWSCVGYPALAIPMGFASTGLPLSLQLAAPPLHESALLRLGHAVQRATDWHLREPPLPDTAAALTRAGIEPGADLAALAAAYQGHRRDVEALRIEEGKA